VRGGNRLDDGKKKRSTKEATSGVEKNCKEYIMGGEKRGKLKGHSRAQGRRVWSRGGQGGGTFKKGKTGTKRRAKKKKGNRVHLLGARPDPAL